MSLNNYFRDENDPLWKPLEQHWRPLVVVIRTNQKRHKSQRLLPCTAAYLFVYLFIYLQIILLLFYSFSSRKWPKTLRQSESAQDVEHTGVSTMFSSVYFLNIYLLWQSKLCLGASSLLFISLLFTDVCRIICHGWTCWIKPPYEEFCPKLELFLDFGRQVLLLKKERQKNWSTQIKRNRPPYKTRG